MKSKFDRYGAFSIVSEIAEEMKRQVSLWGIQEHPNGTGLEVEKEFLTGVRELVKDAEKDGKISWYLVLLEEFAEAAAEEDQWKLRKELIQVAAVAATWVQAIDRDEERRRFKECGSKQLALFAGWEK